MSGDINARKLEHLRVLEGDAGADRGRHYFDQIRLTHRCLPDLRLADVDSSVDFLGSKLTFPLLISCMTGGDHEVMRRINRHLALAAEASGVAMGVGSQRVMLMDPAARASFALRAYAPTVPLIANLGAVQLNAGLTLDHCRMAVEVLGANALCFHLNPLQECAQPGGDTDFRGLADKMAAVAAHLGVPVMVKEVGAGISEADATELILRGIRYLDVAGAGGTSWSRIEYHRDGAEVTGAVGAVFQDWGLPTPEALVRLSKFRDRVTLIGSGGIRSGLDMVKAVVLGATVCGLARPFLAPAGETVEAVTAVIDALCRQFRTGMFLLGTGRVAALRGNRELVCANPWAGGGA